MRKGQGLTLAEVVIVVVVAAALFLFVVFVILPRIPHPRTPARRIQCRNNLNQLAKAMAIYLYEQGDNRWYPCPLGRGLVAGDYNGAEWLASVYWTGVVPDPGVYICPSSPDTNHNGLDLGTFRAPATRFGSQTVSYAGMHYRSLTDGDGNPRPGAIEEDFPYNLPMACDDTQGVINHGSANNGYMSVLYFDSHVDGITNTEIDLERGVGRRPGLLWQLRN